MAEAVAYMAERRAWERSRCWTGSGIFSERDLMKRVVVAGRDPLRTPLTDVMTRDVLLADADESPAACLQRMRQAVCHLPVFSGARLLGLVTMRDLLLADLEEKGAEVRLMPAYISLPRPEK